MRKGAPKNLGTFEWDPEILRRCWDLESKAAGDDAAERKAHYDLVQLILWHAGYSTGAIKDAYREPGYNAEALRIYLGLQVVNLLVNIGSAFQFKR